MATQSLTQTPPAYPPINPTPIAQGNGPTPDLNALGGLGQQSPNPLQTPLQLPQQPPAAGVGNNFQQFA